MVTDQQFYKRILAVMGFLAVFAVVMFFLSIALMEQNIPAEYPELRRELVAKRTQPVYKVITDPSRLQQVSMAPTGGAAKPTPKSGKEVYQSVCSSCHATGVLGAPKFGNASAWKPRIAKGRKTLYKHAIHGFKAMPPKGGASDLSDAEVKAAVDYMVKHSGGYN